MLANMEVLMKLAQEGSYALAAFNAPSLEIARGVIEAAEEADLPVIIAHSEGHNDIMPIEIIAPILINLAERAKVQVAVHLDHSINFEFIKQAIALGFTSVMIDASRESLEDNITITKKVVDYAKGFNVSVEAELGVITTTDLGREEVKGSSRFENIYTDPDVAKEFVERTGIDSLAASFGTAHGIYLSEPKLDFSILKEIHEITRVPLVMHGGSGLADEEYVKAIENGVRKINYFSYLDREAALGVKELLGKQDNLFYTDLIGVAKESVKKDAKRVINVFANKS